MSSFKIDDIVKSLILLAPQAILGFMIRLAKLQELGLTHSNSLQFFNARLIMNLFPKLLDVAYKKLFTSMSKLASQNKFDLTVKQFPIHNHLRMETS